MMDFREKGVIALRMSAFVNDNMKDVKVATPADKKKPILHEGDYPKVQGKPSTATLLNCYTW